MEGLSGIGGGLSVSATREGPLYRSLSAGWYVRMRKVPVRRISLEWAVLRCQVGGNDELVDGVV
jgi:hypothetical protein